MAWYDTVLQITSHPSFTPVLNRVLGNEQAPAPDYESLRQEMRDHYADLRQQLETLAVPAAGTVAATQAAPAAHLDVVGNLRDHMVQVSANYKEALRFAREDGMDHPEVQARLDDAAQRIADMERFWLTPDRLATLPAPQRKELKQVIPSFRRFRQHALNFTVTPDDLEVTSEDAGKLATSLQTYAMTGALVLPDLHKGRPKTTETPRIPTPEAPPDPVATPMEDEPKSPEPYSQYAPEMAVDVGCLPCGRAHIAGSFAALKAAANKAAQGGMADPEVTQRVAMVQEELEALMGYDWTPEKIAASPADEKAILDQVAPATQSLLNQVKTAKNPDDLAQAAQQAGSVWQQIKDVKG